MVKILILLSALALAVKAQVQSPTYQFNVTSPSPNSPYVASQILPCIYDIASNTTSDNLQLSISLVGTNSTTPMIMSADITQGFSFQKQVGGAIVFEHQLNFNLPTNTTAGPYQVVFFDNVSQTNVSIPITISAAPAPTISSLPSGSVTAAPTTSAPANIFDKGNSANAGSEISKLLLAASLILAFVHL
ncbi:uncharacterized protein EV154DRAFT_499374 [Mucor mucedo]|uniref:Uncharacterized protein n=1 Tax=Mucor saturninus TaxID=64648 RepID=A0A8H7UX50_9FUNG|nr:uncharacterized protein EV154DRAFT_499374 [Mucor mucedo]KAG2198965.1 hypothetical protein INT47_013149 [Mucor saturninus]KAI7894107.1 hypothetical protein EV154DRAFT_499374 [Mucor mucedo]